MSEAQLDELGKWNEAICTIRERGGEKGQKESERGRERWMFQEKQKQLYVRKEPAVCCMCYQLINLVSTHAVGGYFVTHILSVHPV